MNWRIILAIARKDIVDAFNNRYVLFAILMPILMSLLFRLAFGNVDSDRIGRLNVAVHDPGNSRLVAALRNSSDVNLSQFGDLADMRAAVKGSIVGGLAVPAGFDDALQKGEQPEVAVYLNPRSGGGERATFRLLVTEQVWAQVNQPFPARITLVDAGTAPVSGLMSGGEFRLDLYLLVMLLVMALSMTGVFAVPLLLVEEKEKNTLQALLVSPAGPIEVALGKALTGLFYSALIVGILAVLNRGWVGNWPVSALAVLLGALFMVALGLLMGGIFRTTMQVNTWSSIVMLALLMPSWLTVLPVPRALETVFRLIPSFYMVEPLQLALAGEASLAKVWVNLMILAGCVAVAFAAVVWTLRREDR
ncbi:MAG: ABC transporter permease [Anaerolineae bacterium]|nr:ABC transporter permease [Anaerolineae bacterium]